MRPVPPYALSGAVVRRQNQTAEMQVRTRQPVANRNGARGVSSISSPAAIMPLSIPMTPERVHQRHDPAIVHPTTELAHERPDMVVDSPQAVMDQSVPVTKRPTVAVWSTAASIAHNSIATHSGKTRTTRTHAVYGAAGGQLRCRRGDQADRAVQAHGRLALRQAIHQQGKHQACRAPSRGRKVAHSAQRQYVGAAQQAAIPGDVPAAPPSLGRRRLALHDRLRGQPPQGGERNEHQQPPRREADHMKTGERSRESGRIRPEGLDWPCVPGNTRRWRCPAVAPD